MKEKIPVLLFITNLNILWGDKKKMKASYHTIPVKWLEILETYSPYNGRWKKSDRKIVRTKHKEWDM